MDKPDPDLEEVRALARRADDLIAIGRAFIALIKREPKDRPAS